MRGPAMIAKAATAPSRAMRNPPKIRPCRLSHTLMRTSSTVDLGNRKWDAITLEHFRLDGRSSAQKRPARTSELS